MTLQPAITVVMFACLFGLFCITARADAPEPQRHPSILPEGEWRLVFEDEFDRDKDALDENWEFQNGPSGSKYVLCSRWRDNVEVNNGILRLIARKETRAGQDWTAANMWTKRKFKYGYWECRYRYAAATGTNNSFWFCNNAGPNDFFELDVNEGHYPNLINTNLHKWHGTHVNDPTRFTMEGLNLAEEFHTYGFLWTDKELVWYFDGKEIRREPNFFINTAAPVYLSLAILRYEIAGPVTDAIDGTSMDVDYVRIYERVEDEAGDE